jgi:hypothetical protein
MAKTMYQVHEHHIISGPRANGGAYNRAGVWESSKFTHAHEGGDRPHQHRDCGPAFYGHLRQQPTFSAKPTGEQRPWQDLEDWQRSFEIHVVGPPSPSKGQPGYIGEGPGTLPAERMIRGFKMRVRRIVVHR